MTDQTVHWSPEADAVIKGDITAALGCVTDAGGVVLTGVAPCGLADKEGGTVGFTTSLAFGKKLERLIRDPRTALAYHSREHGFCSRTEFVLVQGVASVELTPSRDRLEAFAPQAERYLGAIKRGPLWDRLLHEYYNERVFVDISVRRVVAWPDLAASRAPQVTGAALDDPPPSQPPPAKGTGPRVDVVKTAGRLASLPHRLLGYRGADGFPVVVPIALAGHDERGLHVLAPPSLLPPGARRAGLLAHAYRPQLIGLSTRTMTGWLEVGDDGDAVYTPHTAKGFAAPPAKDLLLVSNGFFAKYSLWRARRLGVLERLQRLQAELSTAATGR